MIRRFAAAFLALVTVATPGLSTPGFAANWREAYPTIRVGFVAGDSPAYAAARAEPFRQYLERRLGVPIEILPAPTYQRLMEAQASERVHYAIYSAASFVTASIECGCVEPVGVPTAEDGTLGFHAILLARASGPITSLLETRGTRIAVGPEDAIAGRLIPFAYFADEGVTADAFGTRTEVPDPAAGVAALMAGDVDVALAWSSLSGDAALGYSRGTLTDLVATGQLAMDSVRIVWQSPLIPYGPHAVLSDMPDDLKGLIRNALVDMAIADPEALDAIDRSFGGGFQPIDAAAYEPLRRLVEAPVPAP